MQIYLKALLLYIFINDMLPKSIDGKSITTITGRTVEFFVK